VDDRPFPAFAHPYRDRLHEGAAIGFPVAGLDVEVDAAETVRAVVAVFGAAAIGRDSEPTVPADEAVGDVGSMTSFRPVTGASVRGFQVFPFLSMPVRRNSALGLKMKRRTFARNRRQADAAGEVARTVTLVVWFIKNASSGDSWTIPKSSRTLPLSRDVCARHGERGKKVGIAVWFQPSRRLSPLTASL
jgi:hypothetical protein